MGSIIKARCAQLQMSHTDLAKLLGVTDRQMGRYVANAQMPSVPALVAMSRVLEVSVDELVGITPLGLDLNGEWYAAWQTSRNRKPVINRHRLRAIHAAQFVTLHAEGDYTWQGNLRVIDETLIGSFAALEFNQHSRGALCFDIGPLGDVARGRWIGRFADGLSGTGWGVFARNEYHADQLLDTLMRMPVGEPVVAWPVLEQET